MTSIDTIEASLWATLTILLLEVILNGENHCQLATTECSSSTGDKVRLQNLITSFKSIRTQRRRSQSMELMVPSSAQTPSSTSMKTIENATRLIPRSRRIHHPQETVAQQVQWPTLPLSSRKRTLLLSMALRANGNHSTRAVRHSLAA